MCWVDHTFVQTSIKIQKVYIKILGFGDQLASLTSCIRFYGKALQMRLQPMNMEVSNANQTIFLPPR